MRRPRQAPTAAVKETVWPMLPEVVRTGGVLASSVPMISQSTECTPAIESANNAPSLGAVPLDVTFARLGGAWFPKAAALQPPSLIT